MGILQGDEPLFQEPAEPLAGRGPEVRRLGQKGLLLVHQSGDEGLPEMTGLVPPGLLHQAVLPRIVGQARGERVSRFLRCSRLACM